MPFPSFVYPFSLAAPTPNSAATSTKKGAHHIHVLYCNAQRRSATVACAIELSPSLLLAAANKPSGKTGDDDYDDETPPS